MTQPNPQPLVPGTRKREGASEISGKYRRNTVNISVATWNVRTLDDDLNVDMLLNEMQCLNIISWVSLRHGTEVVDDTFEKDNYVIIRTYRKDNLKRQGVNVR